MIITPTINTLNDMKIDRNKHIWEGWTIGDFIDELSWQIKMIMNGESWRLPFKTKKELAKWCKENQPHYKKPIAEVNNHFAKLYNLS